MNTLRFSVVVTAAWAAALSGARAQDASRDASPLARLERSLDADTYRAVVQAIDDARARDLPVNPLVDRALEGAMKRAPGARIRAAVSTLADRLEVARTALAPSPTEADIAAGAGALAVGVPREMLRTIRSIQPDRPVAVPLGVLTELVARQVPVEKAATLVVQLLRRGATATQLVALGEDVQRDIAAGIDPAAAFDVRTRGVASTLPGARATEAVGGYTAGAPVVTSQDNALRGNTRTPPRGTRRP
jgi:hypothetical protein